jgi:hypothetical protein
MNRKAAIGIAVVGLVALAATVGIFASGKSSEGDAPQTTGKLSKETADLEKEIEGLQARWRANEEKFRDKKEFKELANLNAAFTEVQRKSGSLKGTTETETAALKHLIEYLDTASKIPSIYMMLQINPGSVPKEKWDEKNRLAIQANAAWSAWREATQTLAR